MFTIDKQKVIVLPEYLMISEFKAIWDSDKTIDKPKAYNVFKAIYFICDFKSVYKKKYPESELEKQVLKEYMPPGYKPTLMFKAACKKYKELRYTKTLRTFTAIDKVINTALSYIESFNLDNISDDNRTKALGEVLKMSETVTKSIAQMESLRSKVEKELAMKDVKTKGDVVRRNRELPKSKRK